MKLFSRRENVVVKQIWMHWLYYFYFHFLRPILFFIPSNKELHGRNHFRTLSVEQTSLSRDVFIFIGKHSTLWRLPALPPVSRNEMAHEDRKFSWGRKDGSRWGGGLTRLGNFLYCLFENTENKLKRGWVCQFFLKNTMLPKLILPNFEPDWAVVVAQSDGRAIASPHQMTQVRIQPSIMNISLHSTVEKTKRKRGLGWHIK